MEERIETLESLRTRLAETERQRDCHADLAAEYRKRAEMVEQERDAAEAESIGAMNAVSRIGMRTGRLEVELVAAQKHVTRLQTMSTVEMMCENVNVDAHVREWEARCLKAEARVWELEQQTNLRPSRLEMLGTIQSLEDTVRELEQKAQVNKTNLEARLAFHAGVTDGYELRIADLQAKLQQMQNELVLVRGELNRRSDELVQARDAAKQLRIDIAHAREREGRLREALWWIGHWTRSDLDNARTLHYDMADIANRVLGGGEVQLTNEQREQVQQAGTPDKLT